MKTIVTQIRQKRLMALVLFLLVGMTSVFAQKQVNVSGRITDELNEPMIGISIVDTTDTAFSFTDLATITKYDTIISTAITQSERRMKLDSPLTSTFFFCSAVIVL